MAGSPRVSVVIAAYNSRARLMCAVASALSQTMAADLEIVVVGDGVTDDSGEALMALQDPRVIWENLPTNWGEQSVPSNRGIERARGEIVMFLNQDDLWLSKHVESCVRHLSEHDLDVAFSQYLVVGPGSIPGEFDPGNSLEGVPRRPPTFDPLTFVPASCVAWRADALRRLGGWRRADQVTVSPSQDLLFRAKRSGMRMRMTPDPTVLVLWSGERRGSFEPGYEARDNVAWLNAVQEEPQSIVDEIARAASARADEAAAAHRPALTRVVGRMAQACQAAVGLHPATLGVARRYWRTGGFVNAARLNASLERRDFRDGRGTDE